MITPQYITDNNGNKLSVVIPLPEYEKMIEGLEELEDIRLYDEAKSQDNGERIPIEEAFALIDARRKTNPK